MNMKKEYPVKYRLNNFREHADFISQRDPDGICIKWLENGNEITKTYSQFRSDINALGTYLHCNGFENAIP